MQQPNAVLRPTPLGHVMERADQIRRFTGRVGEELALAVNLPHRAVRPNNPILERRWAYALPDLVACSEHDRAIVRMNHRQEILR